VAAIEDGRVAIAPGVAALVQESDERLRRARARIDAFIAREGIDAPPDVPTPPWPDPPELSDPILELDLRAAGVSAVVWATGFRDAFEWIELPVLGPNGAPIHRRGVTAVPGLYFLGLRWLHKWISSFINGVGEDAEYLAQHIVDASRGEEATQGTVAG